MRPEEEAFTIGIAGNIILTSMNVTSGILTGSLAFAAESINTIGDMATSVLAFTGIKVRDKYPWAENLVGIIVGIVLANLAFQVFNNAYISITSGHLITMPLILLIPAFAGIAINTLMTRRLHAISHEIDSDGLHADAENQKTDIFGSVAIVIAIISSHFGIPYVDLIVSVIIGLLVAKMSVEIIIYNVNKIVRGYL